MNDPTERREKDNAPTQTRRPWCCRLPETPLRELDRNVTGRRLRAIRETEKLLLNGTKLTYHFMSPGFHDTVREAFKTWEKLGIGIRFHEVKKIERAQVRISFDRGSGNWSHLGRDIFDVPSTEPTMHIQDDHIDVALHEIGHTLGFHHEHQNPNAGIVWDADAVYDYFASVHGWTRADVNHNILNKIPPHKVEGSVFDPDSIMCYPIEAGLILFPEQYQYEPLEPAGGLSETDKEEAIRAYPSIVGRPPRVKLLPYKVVRLGTRRGGQVHLLVRPDETDVFIIRTMGKSDTLIVLFEEDADGDLTVVAGDDDSGKRQNARIRVRLDKERKYVLKIRLFFEGKKGRAAVTMSHAKTSTSKL